jgi:hypothetical protein
MGADQSATSGFDTVAASRTGAPGAPRLAEIEV